MDTEGEVRNFEYQAHRKDGSQVWISVNAHAVRDEKGVLLYYEGMSEDITERKLSESRLKLAKEILETLNRPNDIIKLIDDILHLMKEHTGIEAVGIRLKEGEDYPYFVTNGFPAHFLEAENYLCARDDAGEIIRDSQGNPFLNACAETSCAAERILPCPFSRKAEVSGRTARRNFWPRHPRRSVKARTRNRCNSEGYESVALIPLRSRGEIIGLLQMNDSRQNVFTLDRIRFLKGSAPASASRSPACVPWRRSGKARRSIACSSRT